MFFIGGAAEKHFWSICCGKMETAVDKKENQRLRNFLMSAGCYKHLEFCSINTAISIFKELKCINFRTENLYGSGVRDIIDVIQYEVFELHNHDIIDFLLNKYSHLFSAEIISSMQSIINNNCDIELFPTSEKQRLLCTNIVDNINTKLGKNYKYALWLAGYDSVIDHYLTGHNTKEFEDIVKAEKEYAEDYIDAYYVSDFILSNLGEEGTLFAYEELPVKIDKYTTQDCDYKEFIDERKLTLEKVLKSINK